MKHQVLKLVLKSDKGDSVVMVGVTQPNIDMLINGKPILIHLDELGIGATGTLVITYGQDQSKLVEDWRAAGIDVPELPEPGPGEKIRVQP